jgi:hypothetical protein
MRRDSLLASGGSRNFKVALYCGGKFDIFSYDQSFIFLLSCLVHSADG